MEVPVIDTKPPAPLVDVSSSDEDEAPPANTATTSQAPDLFPSTSPLDPSSVCQTLEMLTSIPHLLAEDGVPLLALWRAALDCKQLQRSVLTVLGLQEVGMLQRCRARLQAALGTPSGMPYLDAIVAEEALGRVRLLIEQYEQH